MTCAIPRWRRPIGRYAPFDGFSTIKPLENMLTPRRSCSLRGASSRNSLMKLERNDKITILLAALSERYTSIHAIRSRVENTGIWIIGLSLGAGGWLLQSAAVLSNGVRSLMVASVILAFSVLRFAYLA